MSVESLQFGLEAAKASDSDKHSESGNAVMDPWKTRSVSRQSDEQEIINDGAQ